MARIKYVMAWNPNTVNWIFAGGASLLGACCFSYVTGNQWFFKHLVMPASRILDPERAHKFSIFLASKKLLPKDRAKDPDILVRHNLINLFKIRFPACMKSC